MTRLPLALLLGALCLLVSCDKHDDDRGKDKKKVEKVGKLPEDLSWVKELAPGGALVYSADKEVFVVELDGKTTKIGDGFMPEFSPDGSKVAWVRGGGFWVSDRAGKEPRMLHDKVYKTTGAHWLDNESIAAVIEERI